MSIMLFKQPMVIDGQAPLVTIIALCYNQKHFLDETLDSILKQNYPHIQLIIIDDQSSDGSVKKIKDWINLNNVNCNFIQHQKNLGICASLNEALTLCKGKYYQVIACDDVIFPDKIERQVEMLEGAKKNVAMVYSDASFIDENSNDLYGWFIQRNWNFFTVPKGNIFQALLDKNFIPAVGVLIRTNIVKKLGGYDESLKFEDYDLWLRISKDYEILFDNKPSAKYRIHSMNMHKSDFGIEEQYCLIYQKHIDDKKAKTIFQKRLLKLYSERKLNNTVKKKLTSSLNENSLLYYCLKFNFSYGAYQRVARIIKNIK